MASADLTIYNAGRCFTNAQLWLLDLGAASDVVYPDVSVGWHDTEVDTHKGSFALVQVGTSWESLVGDRIRVTGRDGRSVLAYVFGAASVPTVVSLAFDVWVRLTYPSESALTCRVETLK